MKLHRVHLAPDKLYWWWSLVDSLEGRLEGQQAFIDRAMALSMFLSGKKSVVFYHLVLYVLPLEMQLSRLKSWDHINMFKPTTYAPVPRQDINFQCHISWSSFMFNRLTWDLTWELTWDLIVFMFSELTWNLIVLMFNELTWDLIVFMFNKLTWDLIVFMFNELTWDLIVRFVNNCGMVDHHCLNFLFNYVRTN